jgi:ubiquinone/menaquinone biosynthesis C-methylase UbiE
MPWQLHQAPEEEHEITTGKSIHQARLYDLLGAILMLGRGPAMRKRTIALAHLVPGERVLEVGCGTGESPYAPRPELVQPGLWPGSTRLQR